jgi:hypothetical protein
MHPGVVSRRPTYSPLLSRTTVGASTPLYSLLATRGSGSRRSCTKPRLPKGMRLQLSAAQAEVVPGTRARSSGRRNYSSSTVRSYVHAVEEFARYLRRSPDQLGPDHIREYQVHLFRDCNLSPRTIEGQTAALRFLFVKTLCDGEP